MILAAIIVRHCEERKRRSNPVSKMLDCFASLAMTQAKAIAGLIASA